MDLDNFLRDVRKYQNNLQNESETTSNSVQNCDGWEKIIPPIWDEFEMEDYVEGIVNVYFAAEQEKTKSLKNEKNVTTKNKEISVQTEPIEEILPKWIPSEIEEKKKLDTKSSIKISSKSVKSKPFQSKSCPKLMFNRKDKKSFEISKQDTNRKSIKLVTEAKCLRFIGKPTSVPIDFTHEHPELILDDDNYESINHRKSNNGTLFPRRRDKSIVVENQIIQEQEDEKIASDEQQEHDIIAEKKDEIENCEKTWHDVLGIKSNERVIEAESKLMIISDKSCQLENKLKITTLETSSTPPPPTPSKKILPQKKDVIYDSMNIVQTPISLNLDNFKVQNMPILCIRGECKIQKIVNISIDHKNAETNDNPDAPNVQFYEFVHNSNENNAAKNIIPENLCNLESLGEEKISNLVQIEQQTLSELRNFETIEQQTFPEYPQTEISEEQQTILDYPNIGISAQKLYPEYSNNKRKTRINKYLAPFMNCVSSNSEQEVKSTHERQISERQDYESSFESSTISSTNHMSSETDDEKLKTKISSKKNSYESTSLNSSKKSNSDLKLNSNNSSSDLKLKTENSFDLNILREVFSLSDNEDVDAKQLEIGLNSIPIKQSIPKTVSIGLDCRDLNSYKQIYVQTEKIDNITKNIDEKVKNSKYPLQEMFEKICSDKSNNLYEFRLRQNDSFRQTGQVIDANHLKSIQTTNNLITKKNINHKIHEQNQIQQKIDAPRSFHRATTLPNPPNPSNDDNNIEMNFKDFSNKERSRRSYQNNNNTSSSPSSRYKSTRVHYALNNIHKSRKYIIDDNYDNNQSSSSSSGSSLSNYIQSINNISDQSLSQLTDNISRLDFNNDERKTKLEKHPNFSKMLNKIVSTASEISGKKKPIDPEIERAVEKFLKSLNKPKIDCNDGKLLFESVSNEWNYIREKLNSVSSREIHNSTDSGSGEKNSPLSLINKKFLSLSSLDHKNLNDDLKRHELLQNSSISENLRNSSEESDVPQLKIQNISDDESKNSTISLSSTSFSQKFHEIVKQNRKIQNLSEGEVLSFGEIIDL